MTHLPDLVGENWSRVFQIDRITPRVVWFWMVGVDTDRTRRLPAPEFWADVATGRIRHR